MSDRVRVGGTGWLGESSVQSAEGNVFDVTRSSIRAGGFLSWFSGAGVKGIKRRGRAR